MKKTSSNSSKRAAQAAQSQANARGSKRAEKRAEARASSATEVAGVAVATKNRTKNAKIDYARDGKSCVIEHRERFATILGSTGFVATAFPVNPGQSGSFPWLSGVANRFESYKFERLDYEFKTKTATTSLGDVILAVDYDATDAAPTDSIQAEAYDESVSAAPWQNVTHCCKKINMSKLPQFYVRGDTQPAATDLKMSDMGNLFVCTENQASAALVGYMYVSYRVRLFTPQLRSNDIQVSGGLATGATSMTGANPFGTAGSFDAQTRGVSLANSVFTFVNPGSYTGSVVIVGTVLSGFTKVDSAGMTTTLVSSCIDSGSLKYIVTFSCVSTVANATVTFSLTATTVTAASAAIGSVPYGSLALVSIVNETASVEEKMNRMKLRLQMAIAEGPGQHPRGCPCAAH